MRFLYGFYNNKTNHPIPTIAIWEEGTGSLKLPRLLEETLSTLYYLYDVPSYYLRLDFMARLL